MIGDPETLLEEMPDSPDLFRSYRALIATGHKRVSGGWEYNNRFYPDYLTMGGAVFGAFRVAEKYCKGKGLDIGASYWPFPGATAIDTAYGPGKTALSDIPEGSQDYVFSSHTLEHIAQWQKALESWVGKLRKGGTLFLYLPHPECWLWRKENPFMARHHAWVPAPEIVKKALTNMGCTIMAFDDDPDVMQSFFVCGRKG